ncbi:MAG: ROK family protein [Phycisphaerales bacterium]|nr:ROK family protein [Phycisphaerales bacterium]
MGDSTEHRTLVIDVGGTNLKVLAEGAADRIKIKSGRSLGPTDMVEKVQSACKEQGWTWNRVSMGFPAPVVGGRVLTDPSNLGDGWQGFDFASAFNCPVRIINDAAMQALGSWHGGGMMFLGLGTGLGAAWVENGRVEPVELGHMPWDDTHTWEDLAGKAGLKRLGFDAWKAHLWAMIDRLTQSIDPDYFVLGGGNVKKLDELPPRCERGDNRNAFTGGFRMWAPDEAAER